MMPPAGFEPVVRGGPYFQQLGTVYVRRVDERSALMGLFVAESHTNRYGMAHGGMLMTLADGALNMGMNLVRQSERIVTAHMSVDFLAAARLGDWIEAEVQATRQGRTMAFAEGRLCVVDGDQRRDVLRASAVFSVA